MCRVPAAHSPACATTRRTCACSSGLVRDPELAPGSPAQASRWQSVAEILEQGQESGAFRRFDTRALALMINGAIDGVVAEWIGTPDLDLYAAELETAMLLAVGATG
jgi:TetR/AcrR family transcriptional regulator